jgi:hypothetical protein
MRVAAAALVTASLGAGLCTAGSASAATFFETPSHNIGCAISKSGVRCDIRVREWEPPPKPAWCPVDWGNGMRVGRRGVARFVCAGDTVLGGERVLRYGSAIRRGRFRCASRRKSIRCVNVRNGHGFKLARRSARWF